MLCVRGVSGFGVLRFALNMPYELLNPNAHLHVPTDCLCVHHMLVIDGSLQERSGVTLREAFELEENWPQQTRGHHKNDE